MVKWILYLGEKKKKGGGGIKECERVCEWLEDKQDTSNLELSKGSS